MPNAVCFLGDGFVIRAKLLGLLKVSTAMAGAELGAGGAALRSVLV